MTAILIDTNVLVYAYDRSAPQKQRQALAVLDRLAMTGSGRLSMQVLVEFCSSAMRKLSAPLRPEQVAERIALLAEVYPALPVTVPVVQEALRGVREHRFNFWDAQIWAVALLDRITVVLSEDFTPGAEIEGVRFINPFADDFQPEIWGL
jgi:predicted nucleic acid-binding protein